MTRFESALRKIFGKNANSGRPEPAKQACVFDMDSTLFCVSTRTEKILRDFVDSKEKMSDELRKHLPLLKTVGLKPTDWGLRAAMERHKVNLPREDFEQIRLYWNRRFFSNEYLSHDLMYEGASRFVNFCKESGYDVLYLTGRDALDMREGSLAQLHHHGFPLEHEEDLIMRPKKFDLDEDFKLQALEKLKSSYEKIYFFENEPVIINRILKANLDVTVIYMDSTHSGKEVVPEHLHRITMDSYIRFFEDFES